VQRLINPEWREEAHHRHALGAGHDVAGRHAVNTLCAAGAQFAACEGVGEIHEVHRVARCGLSAARGIGEIS
jgi:hypothetical protein